MKTLFLTFILVLFLTDGMAIDAIPQSPPMILGFRVESISEVIPTGENLFNPSGWILTYGKKDNCTVSMDNGIITMTKTADGWPPCGVSQKIVGAGVGSKFLFSAEVIENTSHSEVYTDFDGSIFKPGTGVRTDVLTSKYPDFTVWLQTYNYAPRNFPITTKWKNIELRRLD